MSSLATTILAITGLFGLLLAVKQTVSNFKYCAICLAVSVTWFTLLILFWFELFENQLLIAILMGQSSLGLYYLLEKRAPNRLLVFRLPVLVSLIMIVYTTLAQALYIDALLIVASIWIIFSLLYVYRTNERIRNKTKAFIECCGDW